MCSKRKRIVIIAVSAAAVIAWGIFVGIEQSRDVHGSETFIEFADKCASGGKFELRDLAGNVVNGEKAEEFQALYENGSYDKMQDFLLDNNYSLGFSKDE